MKLRDANLQVYEKNSFTHPLLRMHHDYFFRRSFESVRTQFLSGESSITGNLPVQSRFISVSYLHVKYGIWRSLECSFCQIIWNSFLWYKPLWSVLICIEKACNFILKKSLAQVFSCEFCEISKNTFFYRTPHVAAFKIIVFKKIRDSLTDFTFSF